MTVRPGQPITADAWNRLATMARRTGILGDRLEHGHQVLIAMTVVQEVDENLLICNPGDMEIAKSFDKRGELNNYSVGERLMVVCNPLGGTGIDGVSCMDLGDEGDAGGGRRPLYDYTFQFEFFRRRLGGVQEWWFTPGGSTIDPADDLPNIMTIRQGIGSIGETEGQGQGPTYDPEDVVQIQQDDVNHPIWLRISESPVSSEFVGPGEPGPEFDVPIVQYFPRRSEDFPPEEIMWDNGEFVGGDPIRARWRYERAPLFDPPPEFKFVQAERLFTYIRSGPIFERKKHYNIYVNAFQTPNDDPGDPFNGQYAEISQMKVLVYKGAARFDPPEETPLIGAWLPRFPGAGAFDSFGGFGIRADAGRTDIGVRWVYQ